MGLHSWRSAFLSLLGLAYMEVDKVKEVCAWRGCDAIADVTVLRSFEDGYVPCYYCKKHYDALEANKCFADSEKESAFEGEKCDEG